VNHDVGMVFNVHANYALSMLGVISSVVPA